LEIIAHERPEDILKAGEALGILEEDLGQEEVLYVHQLLQEYFAARRLATDPQPEMVRTEWRAERVAPSLKETLARIADSDPLPLLPGTGWEETTALAAAMAKNPDRFVADLMKANLTLAGRCAGQPDVKIAEDLKRDLKQALLKHTEDPQADLRARIAAGLVLGELGDPRFERGTGPDGEYLLPPMVEIPGDRYPMGSDEGYYEDEAPAHVVELTPFLIARFPVTNAEWAMFMRAGGYEDERWWVTEEDRAWQRGEGTAEGEKREWRERRHRLQEDFEQIRVWHQRGVSPRNRPTTGRPLPRWVKTGIPWLGFIVYPTHRRLKARKVRHFGRRLQDRWRAYSAGEIRLDEFNATLKGWINHASYGDTWSLRRHMLGRPFERIRARD
jgi:hypothetical protein